MPVENRIVKIQKRNRSLVKFDAARILRAILRAATSVGGFQSDYLPQINDKLFQRGLCDEELAQFLTEVVVICLNSNPRHLISNFPPTIESIQDEVVHALRSYGLQNTADAYECYRWGRHWLREGALRPEQFGGNGFPHQAHADTLAWNHAHDCGALPQVNALVERGHLKGLVRASLDRYEESLESAAKGILGRAESGAGLRMIWVVGPSSSGKTTTTVKLTERLRSRGLRFLMLNLDDYFWSLVEHPTDWINDRNYEAPEAIDIQLLNRHLQELLEGRMIQKPVYNFKEGRPTHTKTVKLEPGQILLLDCLHGLYPPIAEGIDPAIQFRVYIESENGLSLESGKPIRSTDIRLLRRMLRDVRYRNHSPIRTLLHWHYVRSGEFFSILSLRGLADQTINAGFAFELPVLKAFFSGTESHLPAEADFTNFEGFLDAKIRFARVQEILQATIGLSVSQTHDYEMIPGDAPIREFIGGSTLKIPHNE